MKRFYILLAITFVAARSTFAQSGRNDSIYLEHNVSANQEYRVLVYDTKGTPVNLSSKSLSQSRGLMGDIWKNMKSSYSSTALGILTNASSSILTHGISYMVEATRSKKNDWLQQVRKDCTFTKQLPMQQNIVDFYSNISTKGALDPDSILFDGFGCQQLLTYVKGDSTKRDTVQLKVFDLKCSLRTDEYGRARMLNHGKFEVVVDHLIFNPYLCNLPNDSVTTETNIQNLRTPFDFDRRKNLVFQINATITSSWMNEAIQILDDQTLGEFVISATIPDASYLEPDDSAYPGYFVYENPAKDPAGETLSNHVLNDKTSKQVKVTGDCFLVPRSYIGCDNANGDNHTWGTGQYKVNMTLTESCEVNMDFYYDDKPKMADNRDMPGHMDGPDKQEHHWNYHWSEEWKRIKQRKKSNDNIFTSALNDIKMQYGDHKWMNVIVDPVVSTVLTAENEYLAKNLSKWLQLGGGASASTSGNMTK